MNIDPRSPLGQKCLALATPGPTRPARAPRSRPSHQTALPARIVVEFDIPVRAVSEANAGGELGAKIGRKRAMKAAVATAIPPGLTMPMPVVVTLIRLGGRPLDQDDNLPRALKAVKDVVAEWLNVADTGRDSRVKWRFRQRAAYAVGVRVRVEHTGTSQ